MLMRIPRAALLLLALSPLCAQTGWFQPSLLEKPDVQKALQSVDDRAADIVEEWIRLVETPAPSGKEQARAKYIRAEMEKLGLSEIRTDDIFNVSGVRKGTGGGPTVVFAAHMDTVFPEGTDLKVKREGDILRAPGIGDDTSNLMATLEMFRALNRGGVKTKGDLIFLASVQEELGLLGAKHWLETSGYKPDHVRGHRCLIHRGLVRRAAHRSVQVLLHFAGSAHARKPRCAESGQSRGEGDHRALRDSAAADRRGLRHVQAAHAERGNAGRRHGGERHSARGVVHGGPAFARQRHAGSPGERRGFDRASAPPNRKASASGWSGKWASIIRRRCRRRSGSITRWCRRRWPPATTSAKPGTPEIVAQDAGANDSNIAVSMGIPAVAVGAVVEHMPHRLEEYAEASSIVPGIKSLIALAVALTSH